MKASVCCKTLEFQRFLMAHSHSCSSASVKNLRLAFFLNLGFTVIELVGGALTNSMAILADALHDLGDCIGLGMAWYLQKVSTRSRDETYSYGYGRFSLLSALINSVVLITGSLIIILVSIPRIMEPEPVHVQGMFYLALLGVLVNGIGFLRLHYSQSTLNERIVKWHLLEDILGWVAVLVLSVVLYFWDLPVLDSLFSLGFSIFILFNVFRHLRTTLGVFLQSIPDNVDMEVIEGEVKAVEGVLDVHDTHLWSLDGRYHVFTIHIVVSNKLQESDREVLKGTIKSLLLKQDIQHVTLELEREGETCELLHC
jgi:cobalt-zinc-cadmium efflux system protein